MVRDLHVIAQPSPPHSLDTLFKLRLDTRTNKKLKKGAQIPGDQIFYGGTHGTQLAPKIS
jgi:hypothetical protein